MLKIEQNSNLKQAIEIQNPINFANKFMLLATCEVNRIRIVESVVGGALL